MTILASIDPLEWESRFFDLKSGIVRCVDDAAPLTAERLAPWPRLQAKIATDRRDLLDGLQHLGFQLVEGEMDFCIPIAAEPEPARVVTATGDDIPRLREWAAGVFSQSRFRAPWYGDQDGGRFYAQWIENAVRGTFDHECLLLVDEQNNWRGFVTLRQLNQQEGRIGLLAGPGAGAELMLTARHWCAVRGLTRLYVATQISNSAAIRRYIHSGGDVVGSAYWLYR